MAEVLYPRDLMRRTYRRVQELYEPQDIETSIELIDVRTAITRMPDQYKQALYAWYITDGDPEEMAMELHSSVEVAQVTVKAAWNHMYKVLNG